MTNNRRRIKQKQGSGSEFEDSGGDSSEVSLEDEDGASDSFDESAQGSADEAAVDALGAYDDADEEQYQAVRPAINFYLIISINRFILICFLSHIHKASQQLLQSCQRVPKKSL